MFSPLRNSIFIAVTTLFAAISGSANAQSKFDANLLKNGKYTLACFMTNEGREQAIGTFTFNVNTTGDKLSLTVVTAIAGLEAWKDTAVTDLNTFKPIYLASHNTMKDMVVNFGPNITGYHIDKKTGQKKVIKEAGVPSFVDSYTYPFLVSTLPLTSGYKTDLSVFEYKPTNTDNMKKIVVDEVRNNTYVSKFTGKHDVWEVSAVEPATGDKMVYLIDKKTRRLWQLEEWANGQHVRMVDMETDFNSIKAPFDKVATLKMVKGGDAIIAGQVFARDFNDNGTIWAKMQVMNIQAKQVAPKGTQVILIPYNDYFKEWIKVNESQRKKGREGIALSDEAAECIKSTTVYDDGGHFEFVNLMPGEYLLYTEFSYVHSYSQNEVVGYTDHYINGMFQGTSANTVSRNYNTGAGATVKKVVTVSKPGEKVDVKLKKTRA
ncbi:hypothetical protein HF324_25705 [Chitinophaga oryzae]|uniref:Carboxypeptidase regulatory-like domain-containing protein n=1 Tax=Chitinophaga oryzae TaxID=2725414 RepID=A0AAE6ZNC9_9BACT|nr:hypothetical protein [Chitinophaga oryzae]QJB34535.1 hypothetical protein HF329_25840 [Chitinophaga oryzae]QJB41054.1 hypothetical protein HF324_25705 [Chitinophaga oryzae]